MSRKNRQLRAKLILILLVGLIIALHCILSAKVTVSMQIQQIALERQLNAIQDVEVKPRTVVSRSTVRIPIGVFEVTAYTAGFESCGKLPTDPAYGITASGEKVKANHTIAADWGVLPKGTKVMIEGLPHVYTVTDRGGAIKGKKIDIYMDDLDDALEFGRQKLKIYIVEVAK